MKSKGVFLALLLITSAFVPFGLTNAYAQTPLKISNSGDTKSPVVILFKDMTTQDKLDLIKANGGEITRTYKIINGLAANLPEQAIEKLKNNPSILSIDPDIEFKAIEMDANNRIGASSVWTHPTSPATGVGVRVAILDTGIDQSHQEFDASRIILCKSEMGTSEPTCNDLHGHGTHVAGIIGAKGYVNAAKGVAPQVNYLIDKVLDKNGSGSLAGIIAGMDWAVANNADVISMSLGTSAYSNQLASNCDSWYPSMTTAVNNAVNSGVVVVAAAGNSGTSGVGLPACISKTIAVAAVDDTDNIASFSSRGGAVQDHGISAPGVSIYSSLPGNTYASWSGTSMATPVVSGSIALLFQENPSLTPAQVKNALFTTTCKSTTTPSCPNITGTPNTTYGYGRINTLAAFNSIEVSGNSPPVVTITSPANGASSTSGTSVTFSGTAIDTQDGNISGNLIWKSDGTQFGTGASVSVSNLPVGTHTITASVTDTGSLSASSSITFTVNPITPQKIEITCSSNPSSSFSNTCGQFPNRATVYIKVKILDNLGNPIPGILMTTTIDATKTDLSGQSTTDGLGVAQSTYKVNTKRDGTGLFYIYATGGGLSCNVSNLTTCQIGQFTVN
jgi:subtilisin